MSISFWIPDAPTRIIEEQCLCVFDGVADIKCRWCNGKGIEKREESIAPNCNFANVNARDIMLLIGLPQEPCGDLELENAPNILRQAIAALNLRNRRQYLDRKPMTETGIRGARVFYGGNTDNQTKRRLEQIIEVLKYAIEHNQKMCWG